MAGRPRADESARRTRALLELVASGRSLREAVALSRVKPDRVVALLDEPVFRRALCVLLDGMSEAA